MPLSHHIVRGVRIWQFIVIPWLAIVLIVLGLIFLITKYWIFSISMSMLFIIPAIAWIQIYKRKTNNTVGWIKLMRAFSRYIVLLLISLITMSKYTSIKIPQVNST